MIARVDPGLHERVLRPGRDGQHGADVARRAAEERVGRTATQLARHRPPLGPGQRRAQPPRQPRRQQLLLLVVDEQHVVGRLALQRAPQRPQHQRRAQRQRDRARPRQLGSEVDRPHRHGRAVGDLRHVAEHHHVVAAPPERVEQVDRGVLSATARGGGHDAHDLHAGAPYWALWPSHIAAAPRVAPQHHAPAHRPALRRRRRPGLPRRPCDHGCGGGARRHLPPDTGAAAAAPRSSARPGRATASPRASRSPTSATSPRRSAAPARSSALTPTRARSRRTSTPIRISARWFARAPACACPASWTAGRSRHGRSSGSRSRSRRRARWRRGSRPRWRRRSRTPTAR